MATLTSNEIFSVGDSTTIVESVDVLVIPAPTPGSGNGRLIHPTYGTYDYGIAPESWGNIDTDAVIPPIWANKRTLTGATNTLWNGSIKDVEVYERWGGAVSMKAAQIRKFIQFWTNPPTPTSYTVWEPNYINALSYKVIIVSVSCGGRTGINMDYTVLQDDGFVKGPVEIKMRLVAYNV